MKKVIIILAATTFAASATAANETMRQDVNMPFYRIDFRAVACYFDIKINDVSVFSMNMKSSFSVRIPVNHLILESGKQRLSVTIQPNTGETEFDEDAAFAMTLQLYADTGNSLEHVEDILEYDMADDKENVMVYQTSFDAAVPYQITAWQNSTDLNTVENLRQKVETAYQKLGEMITKKQYDAFVDMMREQEKRMAQSLYIDPESSKERMDGLIEDFENGFEFVPLSGGETMYIYADGKLVCLKTDNGNSALKFLNRETEEEMSVEIFFHLKKGDTELTVSP